jgi:hypothetical protein
MDSNYEKSSYADFQEFDPDLASELDALILSQMC